jgi:polyisoprenoid-binding protein YceI
MPETMSTAIGRASGSPRIKRVRARLTIAYFRAAHSNKGAPRLICVANETQGERLMIRTFATAAVVLAVGIVVAPVLAGDVKIPLTGDNTKVTFVGTKPGGKHDGGFKSLTGTATVSGTDITTLKLAVEIDLNSTYTDTEKLTAHLKTPDFFDVKTYPKAKFVSTKIAKGKDGYTVTGDFTLHGKTKEVSFPANIELTDKGLNLASSAFTINRFDWGVSYGKGMVDDNVKLTVKVAAAK